MTIIKNWTIVKTETNIFLKGYVYNHPNKEYAEDGALIISSPIIDGGDGYVTTLDVVYKLEN